MPRLRAHALPTLMAALCLLLCGCGQDVPPQSAVLDAIETPLAAAPGTLRHRGAEVLLEVENILQNPELPNGCEATSLAIVLNYFGVDAGKTDLALNYIPRMDFQNGGGHPEYVYMGDPSTANGFYCYPRPVVIAATMYLEDHPALLRAYLATGSTEDDLVAFLDEGLPVMVWKTTDNQPPALRGDLAWTLLGTDRVYTPYGNLHVAVLRGYDEDNFYLCDPLGITESMARADFMANYTAMGSRAVVVRPQLPQE